MGVRTTVLGGDGFAVPEMVRIPEAEGVLITSGKVQNTEAFKARVHAFGGKDSGLFTPVAYDAMHLLASVMEKVGTDRKNVREALIALHYTEGVSLPVIAFDTDRDLVTGDVEILVVKGGKTESYTK